MTRFSRRLLGFLITALVIAAAAAGIAPFVNVVSMRGPLAAALRRTLGRDAEFGEVHYRILPSPGLTAVDLVIPEDPEFGLEPLAYVGEFHAGVSLWSLASGSLRITTVELVDASLNLTSTEKAGWNFVSFLEEFFTEVRKSGGAPELSIRQSRINFKNGTVKYPLYLNDVDLDVAPPRRPGGELRWRYEASPARTDRAEQGFGRFTGAGRWTASSSGPGRFAVDVELERSAITELLTLVSGRDLGVQGRFHSRATLDGPVNHLALRGVLEIEDVNRPAFFGLRSRNFSLPYEGLLDFDSQTLAVGTAGPIHGKPVLPVELHIEVARLLAGPTWQVSLGFEEIPAPALLDLGHRLGLDSPSGLMVDARVSGGLKVASGLPAQGRIEVDEARVSFGGGPPVRVQEAILHLDDDLLQLEPTGISTPKGASAQLSGGWSYREKKLDLELKTSQMGIGELRAAIESTPGLGRLPAIEACTSGTWAGALRVSREFGLAGSPPPPRWSGGLQLRNARCQPPGLNEPLLIAASALDFDGPSWRARGVEGRWGGIAFRAGARHAAAGAPSLIDVELQQARGEDLARFLQPALSPPRSLLDRTLRRGVSAPAWLRERRIDGRLKIGALLLGKQEFEQVDARYYWHGAEVDIAEISARWRGARFSGRASAGLWREEPVFSVKGVASGWTVAAGVADAELELSAPTLGAQLGDAVKGWAIVSSPGLDLGSGRARHLYACVDYDGARIQQRWKFSCFSFGLDGESWSGRGYAASDGEVFLDLANQQGVARWTGLLGPFTLSPAGR